MIRVLIADDHALVRDGLRHILEKTTDFQVVGEAADGQAALQLARGTSAQVMLLDLSMPGRNGLEIIRQLKEERVPVRVVVLTMHAEHQYAERAFKAGAQGYLTKESAGAELVAAITKVAAGGIYVSQMMAERFARNLNEDNDTLPHELLSDREFDVFRRLVNGESVSEIASSLSVSSKTVSTYKMRILEKMQMHNEASLIRYALKYKLFDGADDDI
jgi:DNA-binding NarL/FixJ family response regulator